MVCAGMELMHTLGIFMNANQVTARAALSIVGKAMQTF